MRSDEHRRIRNHRLSEILILLDLAGVKIFPDEKSLMDKTYGFDRADATDLTDYCAEKNTAEFYLSDELKAAGLFMNARKGAVKKIFNSRQNYDHIFFIDTSNHAPQQLKYIINNTCRKEIRKFIDNNFEGDLVNLYTTLTKDRRTEIMDCTNCDLIAINLFKTGNEIRPELDKKLIVVCIDFQLPYMKKYFRKRNDVEYYQIVSSNVYETEDTR